jgi:hypothetical protein
MKSPAANKTVERTGLFIAVSKNAVSKVVSAGSEAHRNKAARPLTFPLRLSKKSQIILFPYCHKTHL